MVSGDFVVRVAVAGADVSSSMKLWLMIGNTELGERLADVELAVDRLDEVPCPARSPVWNSTSGRECSASLRYSAPTLRPMPRSDHGVWMPYSPPSIVTLALAIVSLMLPRWKPGVWR